MPNEISNRMFLVFLKRTGFWFKFLRYFDYKLYDTVYIVLAQNKKEAHEIITKFLKSKWQVFKISSIQGNFYKVS